MSRYISLETGSTFFSVFIKVTIKRTKMLKEKFKKILRNDWTLTSNDKDFSINSTRICQIYKVHVRISTRVYILTELLFEALCNEI